MPTVPKRPLGANDADPSTPWKRSDPARWAQLGLADPNPSGGLPKGATPADVLVWALVPPGSPDPVEGIVDGVRVELVALADALHVKEGLVAGSLAGLARRLEAAMILLRWTDNRERTPREEDDDEDEPPPSPAPSPAPAPIEPPASSEDVEVTRDAGPDEPNGET